VTSEHVDAAVAYAARGWPVIPLHAWQDGRCTCRALDCASPAKHPRTRHGLHEASTDEATIRRWWHQYRDPNIGLATGVAFDVLDVDGPAGLAALPADLPASDTVDGPTVVTGKGWHVYLAPTGLGNRAGVVPHVDWRGRGGYVVAPPSLHASGRRYRWELPGDPRFGPGAPLRPAPAWLLRLLDPPRPAPAPRLSAATAGGYGRRALDSELGRLARAPEGQRNHELHRAAVRLGQLVAAGQVDRVEVVAALLAVGGRLGLPAREVDGTVSSGMHFGMEHRR
jgi:hypothetical protein